MKKNKVMTCAVLVVSVLAFNLNAYAYVPTYCDQCGAALVEGGTHINSYGTTHYPATGLVDVNHNPIYDTCHVGHDRTEVKRNCPSGHGTKWSGIKHDEYHSSSYCTSHQSYWE